MRMRVIIAVLNINGSENRALKKIGLVQDLNP